MSSREITVSQVSVICYASSVLYSQAFKLSADERAILVAKADKIRAIIGETGKQRISVPVVDPKSGQRIGSIEYQL